MAYTLNLTLHTKHLHFPMHIMSTLYNFQTFFIYILEADYKNIFLKDERLIFFLEFNFDK